MVRISGDALSHDGGVVRVVGSDGTPVTVEDEAGGRVKVTLPDSGGSSSVLIRTITAAEIAARWDAGSSTSSIELVIPAGALALGAFVEDDGFDNTVAIVDIQVYGAGATSAQVQADGSGIASFVLPLTPFGAYADCAIVGGSNLSPTRVNEGGALYARYNGSDAPTTGSSVVTLLILPG